MSTKITGTKPKTNKGQAPKHSPSPELAVEDDERHLGNIADFVARNRDALNDSLRRARKEAAEGIVSGKNIDTIIAECRRRHEKR